MFPPQQKPPNTKKTNDKRKPPLAPSTSNQHLDDDINTYPIVISSNDTVGTKESDGKVCSTNRIGNNSPVSKITGTNNRLKTPEKTRKQGNRWHMSSSSRRSPSSNLGTVCTPNSEHASNEVDTSVTDLSTGQQHINNNSVNSSKYNKKTAQCLQCVFCHKWMDATIESHQQAMAEKNAPILEMAEHYSNPKRESMVSSSTCPERRYNDIGAMGIMSSKGNMYSKSNGGGGSKNSNNNTQEIGIVNRTPLATRSTVTEYRYALLTGCTGGSDSRSNGTGGNRPHFICEVCAFIHTIGNSMEVVQHCPSCNSSYCGLMWLSHNKKTNLHTDTDFTRQRLIINEMKRELGRGKPRKEREAGGEIRESEKKEHEGSDDVLRASRNRLDQHLLHLINAIDLSSGDEMDEGESFAKTIPPSTVDINTNPSGFKPSGKDEQIINDCSSNHINSIKSNDLLDEMNSIIGEPLKKGVDEIRENLSESDELVGTSDILNQTNETTSIMRPLHMYSLSPLTPHNSVQPDRTSLTPSTSVQCDSSPKQENKVLSDHNNNELAPSHTVSVNDKYEKYNYLSDTVTNSRTSLMSEGHVTPSDKHNTLDPNTTVSTIPPLQPSKYMNDMSKRKKYKTGNLVARIEKILFRSSSHSIMDTPVALNTTPIQRGLHHSTLYAVSNRVNPLFSNKGSNRFHFPRRRADTTSALRGPVDCSPGELKRGHHHPSDSEFGESIILSSSFTGRNNINFYTPNKKKSNVTKEPPIYIMETHRFLNWRFVYPSQRPHPKNHKWIDAEIPSDLVNSFKLFGGNKKVKHDT